MGILRITTRAVLSLSETILLALLFIAMEPSDASAQEAAGDPMKIVEKMSNDIGSEQRVSIKTTSIFDEPFENTFIKTTVAHHIFIERPNRMHSNVVFDDGSEWLIAYDGQKVLVLNFEAKEYSEHEFSGTLSELADFVDDNGLSNTPLIDFIRDNYAEAISNESSKVTLIDGYVDPNDVSTTTHHFLFEDPSTDWQLWVAEGERFLPKQLLLEYDEFGRPEYLVQFKEWKFGEDTEEVDGPGDLTGWKKVEFENPIQFGNN